MQFIQKKGLWKNRFQTRIASRSHADSVGVQFLPRIFDHKVLKLRNDFLMKINKWNIKILSSKEDSNRWTQYVFKILKRPERSNFLRIFMMYEVKKFVLLHPQSCLEDIPEPDTRQLRSKMPTVIQKPEIGRNQFLENSPWTPLFRKRIF